MPLPRSESPTPPARAARAPATLLALVILLGCGRLAGVLPTGSAEPEDLAAIRLPAGFTIEHWAEVENARSLCAGPDGMVFVGSRAAGLVHAVLEREGGAAGEVLLLAEGLTQPNGVAYRDGDLYVMEIARLLRLDDVRARVEAARRGAKPRAPQVVRSDFPRDEHHGWKFVAFGPDGRLYVPIGAPCNVCDDPLPYSAIHRLGQDFQGLELVARGVRNTVGFDWHPRTGELWFTDNGRDGMGDDVPPDELNRVRVLGRHYGFPHCHGFGIVDPEFGGRDCAEFEPPVLTLGPHVAALGMRFCTSDAFPVRYRGGIFIAEHGSWDRSEPIGYRVTFVPLDEQGEPQGYEVFAEGWQDGAAAWGRPVDLLFRPDGSLLVSDDKGDAIYRIRPPGG